MRKGRKSTACTLIENVGHTKAVNMLKPVFSMSRHNISSLRCVQSEISDVLQEKACLLVVSLKFL